MAYLDLLIDSCIIQRDIGGAADNYGNLGEDWQTHLTEDCLLQPAKGREIIVGAEVVIADYKLFLDDVDVTEQDRILMDAVVYQILLVEDQWNGVGSHHRELWLRTVR